MKTALVTGVTSQVGREVAIGLTKRGYYVIGTCPKKSLWEAKELVDTYDVEIVTCDVGDLKDTKRLVDAMEEDETIPNGRLDVLIHNEIKSYGGQPLKRPTKSLNQSLKLTCWDRYC